MKVFFPGLVFIGAALLGVSPMSQLETWKRNKRLKLNADLSVPKLAIPYCTTLVLSLSALSGYLRHQHLLSLQTITIAVEEETSVGRVVQKTGSGKILFVNSDLFPELGTYQYLSDDLGYSLVQDNDIERAIFDSIIRN